MYVLQPQADRQASKISFADFRWIGPYIVEKALPNRKYLVLKLGTNKTRILHRMRLRLFTPRQPITYVQTTSHQWKPDPEAIIKHDDLYARPRESEYKTPISDNGQREPDSNNSPEIRVRHDLPYDETCNIPGTIQDSPESLPHTDEIGDGSDTDHYMEPDAQANSELLRPADLNPRCTKYDLRHNPKMNCIDDYRFWSTNLSQYGTRNNYVNHTCILEKCYRTPKDHLRTYPHTS